MAVVMASNEPTEEELSEDLSVVTVLANGMDKTGNIPFSHAKKRQVKTSWHELHERQLHMQGTAGLTTARLVIGDQDDASKMVIVRNQFEPAISLLAATYGSDLAEVVIEGSIFIGDELFRSGDVHILRDGTPSGPWLAGPDGVVMIRVFRHGRYDLDQYPNPDLAKTTHGDRKTSWAELLAGSPKRNDGIFTTKFILGDPDDLSAPVIVRSQYSPEHIGQRHTHGCDYVEVFLYGSMEITRHKFSAGQLRLVKQSTFYGPLITGLDGATVLNIFSHGKYDLTKYPDQNN